eukprot:COSAG05_NODE_386_length_10463_cov_4.066673_6_plen_125_part_00
MMPRTPCWLLSDRGFFMRAEGRRRLEGTARFTPPLRAVCPRHVDWIFVAAASLSRCHLEFLMPRSDWAPSIAAISASRAPSPPPPPNAPPKGPLRREEPVCRQLPCCCVEPSTTTGTRTVCGPV